jgi:hypothetical protein
MALAKNEVLKGCKFAIAGKIQQASQELNTKENNNGSVYNFDGQWIYSQSNIATIIRNHGGQCNTTGYYSVTAPITKTCTHVILGKNPTPKALAKLEEEGYKHIVPISFEDFIRCCKEKTQPPKSREDFEKYLKKQAELKIKEAEEKERQLKIKKIKDFAKQCGIDYNEKNPEKSVYKNKKMDITHIAHIEKEISTKPLKKRLDIKPGKYPYVSVDTIE